MEELTEFATEYELFFSPMTAVQNAHTAQPNVAYLHK